ncbi:MAG TPA: hypothetical protein VGK23_08705 [Methanomassiliicoccales archaeon]|jgi:hypothetical protein
MNSSSGQATHSPALQEDIIFPVEWKIIASKEVQENVTDMIREAFDKAGFRASYTEKDGVNVLVQIRGRIPRGP